MSDTGWRGARAAGVRTSRYACLTFHDGRVLVGRVGHKWRGWNFRVTDESGATVYVLSGKPRADGEVVKVEIGEDGAK